MRQRDCENGEALGDILLEPGGEVWCSLLVFLQELLEEPLGFLTIRRVENGSEFTSDRLANLQSRRMVRGVALKVDLATLPGHTGEDSIQRRFKTGMIVSRDESQTAKELLSNDVA